MTNNFFSPWEGNIVDSWAEAQRAIEDIVEKSGSRALVWRGQVNADWNLHSSLYRYLKEQKGGVDITEDNLLKFEKRIVNHIRKQWRVSDITYLQLLAQLQHYGAPTRLIDVSLNPYVAVWMAVEFQGSHLDGEDGRLFAFHTSDDSSIPSGEFLGNYECPWDFKVMNESGVVPEMWTREKWTRDIWFWRPPAYNERISAQYSGFLVGGVPNRYSDTQGFYRKAPSSENEYWRAEEVRSFTSVSIKMVQRDRKPQTGETKARPAFTLRISAKAKKEIRDRLERTFMINSSTVYPDAPGMASEIKKALDRKDPELLK